jgi:hypothetical protein
LLLSGLCFRLRRFEAHPRRALDLAELDQLSGRAFRQRSRHFVTKIGDRFQVMARFEKLIEGFAGEDEDLVEYFVFGVDVDSIAGAGKLTRATQPSVPEAVQREPPPSVSVKSSLWR